MCSFTSYFRIRLRAVTLQGLLACVVLASVKCIVLKPSPHTSLLGNCHGHQCLERWLNYNDGVYRWRHVRTRNVPDAVVHELDLWSLKWSVASPDVWQHVVTICIPDPRPRGKAKGWATLLLNDMSELDRLCTYAKRTGAVAAHLSDLPEKRVDIVGNGSHDTNEEYIKARSWREYVDHPSHPEYVVEMAAAKATSKAMDAIEAYSSDRRHMPYPITKFIVIGASKRGIAAYTACAFDTPRVRAVVPQIINIHMGRPGLVPRPGAPERNNTISKLSGMLLDVPPARNSKMEKIKEIEEEKKEKKYQDLPAKDINMNAYDTLESGKILSADGSAHVYDDCGVTDLDTETARRIYSIIDPYWYIEKITCGPILVQHSGNDVWFGVDVSRSYYTDVPNATYQIDGPSIHLPMNAKHMETAEGFVVGVIWGLEQPKIQWTIDPNSGDIDVELITDHEPMNVSLYSALDQSMVCSRRFPEWNQTELPKGDRHFIVGHPWPGTAENRSCQGIYVAVDYAWPPQQLNGVHLYALEQHIFRITTQVSVMPNADLLQDLYHDRYIDVADSDLPASPQNPHIYIEPDWESHRRRTSSSNSKH